jgi:P27 family predicted phage terminase small subunit
MPTKLRLLKGGHPERVNRHEPQPADLPVVKPVWLTGDAAGKWDELVPHLQAMGVVTGVDTDALAAYCECFARWRKLMVLCARTPPVWKRGETPDGQPIMVKNPVWSMVRDAETGMLRLAREFGFTPSARSGLRVGQQVGDLAERLLTGGTIAGP